MRFDFFGTLRHTTNHKTLTLDLPPGATLREALEALFETQPALREVMLDESARLRQNLPIFVNGRNPRLGAEGWLRPVEAEDVVSVFAPFTSGRMNVEVLREAALGKRSER